MFDDFGIPPWVSSLDCYSAPQMWITHCRDVAEAPQSTLDNVYTNIINIYIYAAVRHVRQHLSFKCKHQDLDKTLCIKRDTSMTQQPWGFKLTMTEAVSQLLPLRYPSSCNTAGSTLWPWYPPTPKLEILWYISKILKAPTIIFILCLKPSISGHQSCFLGKNLRPRVRDKS